jgi:hypothetical protein
MRATMEKKYSIETIDGVITVRFHQEPEAIDICKSLDDAAQNSPGNLRLWDFTCGANLPSDDIEIVAHHAKSIQLPSGKVAIVAPQDLTFGIFRIYAANREETRVKLSVFRSEPEAREWLNKESVG